MREDSAMQTQQLEKTDLTLGFIPLSDCAPLVVAYEKGYFKKYGLNVSLSKETSWANIRDKVAIGILDGAQMLAPMPLSMTLGLGPIHKPVITAFSMSLNGNAITVSSKLYSDMQKANPEAMLKRSTNVQALKTLIDNNREKSAELLTFAVVYPFSSHSYELRYWMASAGIDPDNDVRLVVVPPSQMVKQLEQGSIDGYCVGEPWNSLAVDKGIGHTLITKYEIWNNSPEKVLGLTEEWAEQHPNTHQALLCALLEASAWMDRPGSRVEVASIISAGVYVNAPEHIVRSSLSGLYQYESGSMPEALSDFSIFHRYEANYPWRSHAMWFITQMIRWGHISDSIDINALSDRVYRPDLFRSAADHLGISSPLIDHKSEGSHETSWKIEDMELGSDLFFDKQFFTPDDCQSYLHKFELSHPARPFEQLLDNSRQQQQSTFRKHSSQNRDGYSA